MVEPTTQDSPAEPQIDQVWLTPSSSLPFWAAFSLTITLLGVFMFPVLAIGAGIVTAILILKWIGGGVRETSELPRG